MPCTTPTIIQFPKTMKFLQHLLGFVKGPRLAGIFRTAVSANEVPGHYTTQFDKNWTLEAQQHIARLRECSSVKTGCTGKAETHNRISKEEMEDQTSRLAKTQGTELTTTKRWVFPRAAQKTTFLDEWDAHLLGETVLPTGEAVQAHAAAAGRKMDRRLLDAIEGSNFEGLEESLTTRAAPTESVAITFDNAGGSSKLGFTLTKWIKAKGRFAKNEVYGQEQKMSGDALYVALGQDQLDDLLFGEQARLASSDFNRLQALVDGEVDYYLGCKVKRTELLTETDAGGGDTGVQVLFWVKSMIKFDIWSEMTTRMSVRADLSDAIQIRSKLMCGGTRVQDNAALICNVKKPS